jgi:DEAD/DEAH box helicase domain-containing protein
MLNSSFGHSSFFSHSDLGISHSQAGISLELFSYASAAFIDATMAKNILYFDLETQKSADEVGGWGNISKMGMSVGVTCSSVTGEYKIYGEKQVDDLIKDLQRADLVVGFNHLRFDYEVLHGYTALDLSQLPTLDMLVELQNELGHRLSLDSIATATFGVEKTAEGLQAIRWFKDGRLAEIAEYCCYDVKITKLVYEYGQQHRQIHYTNRFGKKMTAPVKW